MYSSMATAPSRARRVLLVSDVYVGDAAVCRGGEGARASGRAAAAEARVIPGGVGAVRGGVKKSARSGGAMTVVIYVASLVCGECGLSHGEPLERAVGRAPGFGPLVAWAPLRVRSTFIHSFSPPRSHPPTPH